MAAISREVRLVRLVGVIRRLTGLGRMAVLLPTLSLVLGELVGEPFLLVGGFLFADWVLLDELMMS